MKLDAETFLRDLLSTCDGKFQSGFLTLSAIHPSGDRPTPSRHIPLNRETGLANALAELRRANERGWGAYFGVALRSRDLGRWGRGGKSDLLCLPALFVDIDQPEHALTSLAWFELPASCILHSGRGYHAYWFLREPSVDFAQADLALRGLAQYFHGDEALTVAQSMRLPDTINTKPGREGAFCSAVGYHPDRLYDLSEFTPFMPDVISSSSQFFSDEGKRHHHHIATRELPTEVLETLTEVVAQRLDGHLRSNGFIAAYCPFPHLRDRPGMHFSFNPQTGWGYCFGKHGKVSPSELCHLLAVPSPVQATLKGATA